MWDKILPFIRKATGLTPVAFFIFITSRASSHLPEKQNILAVENITAPQMDNQQSSPRQHIELIVKFIFLAMLFSVTSNAFARTLYLDCIYKHCVAKNQCSDSNGLTLNFLIDTTNRKAWRLAVPTARPVDFTMNNENRYNLIDKIKGGSVEITTINTDLNSSHSIHPMNTELSGHQVQQYYGACSERIMFAYSE